MNRRLTARQAHSYVDDAELLVRNLRPVLDEIVRRGEYPVADGFPSGGGSGGSGLSDPTAVAAITPPPPDPIGADIERLLKLLLDIGKRSQVALSLQATIMEVGLDERGRISSVPICERCNDPILGRRYAGFDGKCWQAFLRFGATLAPGELRNDHRKRFISEYKAELEQQTRTHVHSA